MEKLSPQDAEDMVRALKRREVASGRPENTWYMYENHVFGAADAARTVAAEIDGMDAERLYVAALLHDIAKMEERNGRFHGIVGYEILKGRDEEAARACLLHTFPRNRVPPFEECSAMFFGSRADYDFVRDYAAAAPVRDEDLLVQLADVLANKDGFVTVERRFEEASERRGFKFTPAMIGPLVELKLYFDRKIGKDIYALLNRPVRMSYAG